MSKVLCPGEALIDFVGHESMPLEACQSFLKKAGGAPANAAGAMAKLGVDSYFLGAVGKDPFGAFLKAEMDKYQINTGMLQFTNDYFTTQAFVSIDQDGERDFIFNRGADEQLEAIDLEQIKDFDCIHFASATAFLGGKLEDEYFRLLQFAKDNDIMVTFDANYRDALFGDNIELFVAQCKKFISESTIVKLSEEEAELISGESEMEAAGKAIAALGCDHLIITQGKAGSKLFTNNQVIDVPTIDVKMIDSTGAGDAFIGTVVAKATQADQLTAETMTEIVRIANIVGAKTTENYGALEAIPDLNQLI